MAADNRSLGRFILDNIPPAPRGVPQIEVKFDIDANGILTVTATDKATNKSQSIKVEGSIGISDEEIERMKKDAEINAAVDQAKRDLIEAKNIAENLIYQSEKTIKEGGDKISEGSKKEVEDSIAELKKVKDSDNIEEIKKATEKLSESIQKVGAEIYQQQQQEQPKKEEGPEDIPEAEVEKE
jgi:molecular chaperone DnaK